MIWTATLSVIGKIVTVHTFNYWIILALRVTLVILVTTLRAALVVTLLGTVTTLRTTLRTKLRAALVCTAVALLRTALVLYVGVLTARITITAVTELRTAAVTLVIYLVGTVETSSSADTSSGEASTTADVAGRYFSVHTKSDDTAIKRTSIYPSATV